MAELGMLAYMMWPEAQRFDGSGGSPYTKRNRTPAPGLFMTRHHLSAPVTTCQEAALARGIPLANELKSLILRTDYGLVVAHLPGDKMLSMRKVKTALQSRQAYLAGPADMSRLRLSRGTVCAFLEPVWSMPHLISDALLEVSPLMTNDGTNSGYFIFQPHLLVEAETVKIGDFGR